MGNQVSLKSKVTPSSLTLSEGVMVELSKRKLSEERDFGRYQCECKRKL